MQLRLRPGAMGDALMLVLGLNAWATLLLIPSLHHHAAPSAPWAQAPLIAAPATLLAGVALRRAMLLLGIFPLTLVLAVLCQPHLVGVNVHSAGTFALVASSFVGYSLGSALLLQQAAAPPVPPRSRPLTSDALRAPPWQPRRHFYAALAAVAALFPIALIHALFLRHDVLADLRRYFPERAPSASVLFGVFAVALWLALFQLYLLRPLRVHARGDPDMQADLLRLRRSLRRSHPRWRFYVWVAVALALMGALLLLR